MEFLDKLITLSQYGLTETAYKTRTEFMLNALSREMERFYNEVLAVPMLAPLAKALMETYQGERYFPEKVLNENNNNAGSKG